MEDIGLVYIGKIIESEAIPNADFIVCVTVICGKGGKWKGIVRKDQFEVGCTCVVYLPDSQIPQSDEMKFMEATAWRVRMRRFRGAPSEVVIMPIPWTSDLDIGHDITKEMGVTKYHKPIPFGGQRDIAGVFPGFIPKTDEPNYQSNPELIQSLIGKPYYITEKCDGTSTTAYKYKENFGVCMRNWELKKNPDSGYWAMAIKYNLEEKLPEGYALQWETCGPGVQSNPMGLKEITGFAFSGYKIDENRYLTLVELIDLCKSLQFPMVEIKTLHWEKPFSLDGLETLGEGKYPNGKQREGVVVRSVENMHGRPISFKVINLNYEK